MAKCVSIEIFINIMCIYFCLNIYSCELILLLEMSTSVFPVSE